MRNKKGFTLIELIVVLAIILVLATIASPAIFSYVKSAQQRADQASAKQIQAAISLLFALDSGNEHIDNVTGGVMWSQRSKNYIRAFVSDKLGSGSKIIPTGYNPENLGENPDTTKNYKEGDSYPIIPRPKENLHAFYMYLLPPYTVVSLKVNDDNTSGTSASGILYKTGEISKDVNDTYLKLRYPITNYPQVGAGTGSYEATDGETAREGTSVALDFATTGFSGSVATVGKASLTHVGWLNRGVDYNVTDGEEYWIDTEPEGWTAPTPTPNNP
ncbi:MAG: type II secretion system protein [Clostridiales bacterium]|nr:type II secretion system protein [Clostridiales bacterium]